MKAVGPMTLGMDRALRDIRIKILFMDILKMAKLVARGFILGVMGSCMMDSGFRVANKVLAYGEEFLMIIILENGFLLKLMGMEFINGLMEIDMKANGK
jgi:hypothetical protein